MEKWAYVNLEGDEQVLVEKFAAMAAQTKLDNKDAIPSSICAHSLEPVVEPSRGLAKKIKHHLDTVLGRETQSLRSVAFKGGFRGGPPTTQGAALSGGGVDQEKILKTLQEAINPKSSKSKLTDVLKHTISTIMGSSFDLECNKRVAQR